MTREQINQILSDGGVDTANSKLVVSALLNAFNDEKRSAVEEASKTAKEEASKKFEGYVKPEDFKKAQEEIESLKDAGNKTNRTSKYKEKGLKDKWVEYAESKLKDSKDFDKDFEEFVKNNAELFESKTDTKEKKETPVEEQNPSAKIQFGNVTTTSVGETKEFTLDDAVSEYYKK